MDLTRAHSLPWLYSVTYSLAASAWQCPRTAWQVLTTYIRLRFTLVEGHVSQTDAVWSMIRRWFLKKNVMLKIRCHQTLRGEESFTWAPLRQSMNIKIASLLVFKTFSSHGGLFKIMTRLYFLFYSAMFCVRFSATLSGWEGAMFYAQTISWPLSSVSLFQRRCEDVWEWSNGEWNCVWGK